MEGHIINLAKHSACRSNPTKVGVIKCLWPMLKQSAGMSKIPCSQALQASLFELVVSLCFVISDRSLKLEAVPQKS